jgi:NuA3 HAT complex component NTO1
MSIMWNTTWTIKAHPIITCICVLDLYWLQLVNKERHAESVPPVDYHSFEAIMDIVEKEWFNLTKDLVRPETDHLTPEESACAICNEEECDNSNAIVFCDGCNLAVHQDCYGIPYVPEGQWLCRKCMLSPSEPVKCIFCPNKKGAFKQTTNNKWAHLLCALWIPEVGLANTVYMEPIEGISKVPRSRWKLICTVCKRREGACIQCADRNCFTAFHVTCARKSKFYMSSNATDDTESMKAYCEKHSPLYDMSETSSVSSVVETNEVVKQQVTPPPTSAVPKNKLFRRMQIPAVVNNYIAERVYTQAKNISISSKKQFINKLFRYWALKREMHRGAPLLKRLHLEPWTFRAAAETLFEQEEKKHEMTEVRASFEKLRLIVGMTQKRERYKLRRHQLIRSILEIQLFPVTVLFGRWLQQLKDADKQEYFWAPVDTSLVPDYLDVITTPMDFYMMERRLSAYESLEEFEHDAQLVFSNAMQYNGKDPVYYKTALKMQQDFDEQHEQRRIETQTVQTDVFFDPTLDVAAVFDDTPPPKEATPPMPESIEAESEKDTPPSKPLGKRKRLDTTPMRRSVRTTVQPPPETPSPEPEEVTPVRPSKKKRRLELAIDNPLSMKRVTLVQLKALQDALPPLSVGDLVWAKLVTFPYYPGIVVDPQDPIVPAATLKHTRPQDALLIQYYELKPSFSWMIPDKLLLHLGTTEIVDTYCLYHQNFMNVGQKPIHEAFRRACEQSGLNSHLQQL